MAQIDFPSNPQVNDTFIANGITYTWDGVKWDGTIVISGSSGTSDFSSTVTAPSYEADNTGTDTVLFDFQRNNASQFQITTEPAINVIQPLDLRLPDNSALPFRIMEGTTTEYLRVTTTDGSEQFTFKKGVTTEQVLTLSNDVACDDAQKINIADGSGTSFRVMNAGTTELFRFNTNVSPSLADFSCAVKLDGDVEAAFGTLTVSQDLNVQMESSSNAVDFLSDDGQFALRFNTSAEQLETDFDIYNDNNDAVIGLGGTIASPNLQLVGDGTATFGGAISATGNVTAGLFQQAGSSGFPTNSGTSHFYSDVSIGFTGSQSQLSSNVHLSKFIIQRNYAGQEGGLIVKGGRPGEAANGTQNILAVHYQDVAAGDDIRYHGSTANAHSLQNKTSVNALIDNKITSVGGVQQSQGTFTATLAGATSNPSVAQTTTGNYIRVGDLVTVYIAFHNMAATGGSGTVQITGLPFNIENLSSGSGGQFTEPVGSVWFDKDLLFDTQRTVVPFGPANTTNIHFVAQGVQGYLPYTGSPGSGMRLEVQLSYITDAS